MRRTLTAAAAALALGAATMLGAVPAGADPEEPEGLPALAPGDKVSEPLRAAEGQVTAFVQLDAPSALDVAEQGGEPADRSEEHTSELQSRGHLVCRLLLEK